ncbi:MAG: hypothetical protein OEW19_04470 [Acidobacteriota bacterium]|nr:hypothetical protein [Acidobacteriota bacterium]
MRRSVLPLLVLFAAALSAAEPRLEPGSPLPTLTGTDLAGRQVVLPEAARGRLAVLLFGFSYASRKPVEAWAEHIRRRWGSDARVSWYQLPMIGGFGRLAKPFITGGMRRETPPEYHGNAVVVFGGVGGWKQRLAVQDDKTAHLVVLDRGGIVRWQHAGAVDEPHAALLDDQLDRLMGTL